MSLNIERFAGKIVDFVCEARMTYELLEAVGFWISQNSTSPESDLRLITLADSIKANIERRHNGNTY